MSEGSVTREDLIRCQILRRFHCFISRKYVPHFSPSLVSSHPISILFSAASLEAFLKYCLPHTRITFVIVVISIIIC